MDLNIIDVFIPCEQVIRFRILHLISKLMRYEIEGGINKNLVSSVLDDTWPQTTYHILSCTFIKLNEMGSR